LIEFLKPTNNPSWLEKKIKNALQAKGVRQFKKFHLQDERNHLHQDVLHDKPILPNQVTKGILAPNSTMNIQNSSGLAKGAAQIQLANTINDRSRSIILLVTPGALPKFHRQPN